MKTSNLFVTGLTDLVLGACAGTNPTIAPQEKSKLEKCYSNLSACERGGYENFVSTSEAYSKQDAVDMAKLNVKMQMAKYLFGTLMTSSTTSTRTSIGKSSELPRINDYTESSTQIKVTKGTLPKIIWEWECLTNTDGNKCYVVGYIPK